MNFLMNKKVVVALVVLFVTVFVSLNYTEGFATSPGTLLQLAAKGGQDAYLTGVPRYPYDYLPIYGGANYWVKHKPYYFYSRAPPTWVGERPIYGRPFYERPYYYTPLGRLHN